MATTEQRAELRKQLRAEGRRPIEVWLANNEIELVDEIKDQLGFDSRAELFSRLLHNFMQTSRTVRGPDRQEIRG